MPFSWPGAVVSDAELTAEFNFWKNHFLGTACLAAACAVMSGILIAGWPADAGKPELRSFVKQLWTAFVEFAFWFGFLVGLLLAASRRIGCALAGTVPWRQTKKRIASQCGQAACGLFFGSCLLWVGIQFARQLGDDATGTVLFLAQLVDAGFFVSGVCLLVTLGSRLMSSQE
jgi:hypothetical protein